MAVLATISLQHPGRRVFSPHFAGGLLLIPEARLLHEYVGSHYAEQKPSSINRICHQQRPSQSRGMGVGELSTLLRPLVDALSTLKTIVVLLALNEHQTTSEVLANDESRSLFDILLNAKRLNIA